MTGETLEVRSDKGKRERKRQKKREKKEKKREKKRERNMSRINYHQSAFNFQKEKSIFWQKCSKCQKMGCCWIYGRTLSLKVR